SVLWENVTVENGANLKGCVVGAGVKIQSGETLDRVVVVRKDIVREIERGYVAGENLIVPIL
ncbi:MAG: hypothetical protein ACREDR_49535, partial [Blastocatellia bacterium]